MSQQSWMDWSSREVDMAVERQHERELVRYEAEQDRREAEVAESLVRQDRHLYREGT